MAVQHRVKLQSDEKKCLAHRQGSIYKRALSTGQKNLKPRDKSPPAESANTLKDYGPEGDFSIPVKNGKKVKRHYVKRLVKAIYLLEEMGVVKDGKRP